MPFSFPLFPSRIRHFKQIKRLRTFVNFPSAAWASTHKNGYRRWFGMTVCLTLVFGIAQWGAGHTRATLFTPAAPSGIVSLELARDARTARAVLESWNGVRTGAAFTSLILDFGFIFGYARLLFGMCHWAARRIKKFSPGMARVGHFVAIFQLAAGAADLMENGFLLVMIVESWLVGPNVPGLALWAFGAFFFAVVKFALIAIGVAYYLLALREVRDAQRFCETVRIIGFSLFVAAAAPFILFLPQGLEALRVLGEDANRPDGLFRIVLFFLCAFVFAYTMWYWARVLLYRIKPGISGEVPGDVSGQGTLQTSQNGEGEEWAAVHLPRWCALGPLLLFAVALFKVALPRTPSTAPDAQASVYPADNVAALYGMSAAMAALAGAFAFHLYRRNRGPAPDTGQKVASFSFSPEAFLLSRNTSTRTRRLLALTLLPGAFLYAMCVGLLGKDGIVRAGSLGPVAVLLLGLSVLVPIGGLLLLAQFRTAPRNGPLLQRGIPFLTLLLVAAGAFAALDLGDNHAVRVLPPNPQEEAARDNRSPGQTTAEIVLPDVNEAFTQWLQQRADRKSYEAAKEPYPVFFVAAEGGGIRAAYQTGHVLAALQQDTPAHFAQHAFLISSVSGGSLGASVFAALAGRYAPNGDAFPGQSLPLRDDGVPMTWTDVSDNVLRRDLLSPALAGMLSPDLVQRFLPFTLSHNGTPFFDRAQGLERGLESAWEQGTHRDKDNDKEAAQANPFTRSFYELNQNRAVKSTPALFLNATCVETGDRLVVSSLWPRDPADKTTATAATAAAADAAWNTDTDGLVNRQPGINGMHTLASVAGDTDVRLSTAAVMSARFPLISSSGALFQRQIIPNPTGQEEIPPTLARIKRRYVDGGYFENSGLSTLDDLLLALGAYDSEQKQRADYPGRPLWYPVIITITFENAPQPALPPAPAKKTVSFASPTQHDTQTVTAVNATAAVPQKGETYLDFPGRPRASAWDELSPIAAYLDTGLAHGSAARNRLPARLHLLQAVRPRSAYLPITFREEGAALPLGWLLSRAARREIQRQAGSVSVARVFAGEIRHESGGAEKANQGYVATIKRLLTPPSPPAVTPVVAAPKPHDKQ